LNAPLSESFAASKTYSSEWNIAMTIKSIVRTIAGCIILIGAMTGLVEAQATRSIAGNWIGNPDIKTPGNLVRMVPMVLSIVDAGVGQNAGSIRFGAPKSCMVALEFSGVDAEQDSWFRVNRSNGGYCDRLQSLDAVVEVRADAAEAVVIRILESGVLWEGTLRLASSKAQ
jgi:hypothetical protein